MSGLVSLYLVKLGYFRISQVISG